MSNQENLKIIAPVGLTGSGKSTVIDYFTEKNIPKVYGGGIFYQEMAKVGMEATPENQVTFRKELREKEGKDFLINKVIEEIHNLASAGQHRIVFDGLYSWSEYKALKHAFPGELTVIGVVMNKHLRHHRLANRPERPFTEKQANDRDWSEIEDIEKGGPIAIADFFVDNNRSVDELHAQIDEIVEKIDF